MTDTAEQIEFHVGDEVRLPNGTEGVIEDLNPNNPPDEYWALIKVNGLTDRDIDSPEGLTLVRTAAEMRARKIPTPGEFLDFLSSAMHSGFDLQMSETDIDESENVVEFYGRTEEGLPFAGAVKLIRLHTADE